MERLGCFLISVVIFCTGCLQEPRPELVTDESTQVGSSAQVWIPDNIWNVVQNDCAWCHTPEYPLAGFDFSQRTLTLAQVEEMGVGVLYEMAPLIRPLAPHDKTLLLKWVSDQTGPPLTAKIPATYHWESQDLIANLADGEPVPGFAFVIEDEFIDPQAWTVETYTDRFGITFKSIALDQTHSVDRSVFSSSENPSSYFVPKGVPWHGRFYDCRMEGDMRVRRWMSVGMLAADMTPTGRSNRDYVRLQLDRDAFSLRTAPTEFETYPWGGSGGSPGADEKMSGDLNEFGFYQNDREWLHFVFTTTRVSNGTEVAATITRRGTGEVLAELSGFIETQDPLQGMFFLHAYAVGDKRNWANLVFDAKVARPAPSRPVRSELAEARR